MKKIALITLMATLSTHPIEDEQIKPIAKTIGGIVICAGSLIYGTLVGPAVTLFGIADDFDGQVIIGPLISAASIPTFLLGRKLLKKGITDLDQLEKGGIANPLRLITDYLKKKKLIVISKADN